MKRLSLTGYGLHRHLKVAFALMMIIPCLVCAYLATSYLHLSSLALLMVITITISLLGLSLIRGRLKSFLRIATGAKAIAEGDLTVQVKAEGDDETTQLANSLHQIRRRLSEDMMELQEKSVTLVRAYKEIKDSHAKLTELNREKSNLIATISHELRSPLTSINGYAKVILDGDTGRINDTQKQFLTIVADSADRMSRLVDNLLDLSRLESGKVRMEMGNVRIEDIVLKVEQNFGREIGEKEIRLRNDFSDELPPVYADPNRIEAVVGNLLANAIKFTPSGGRITVQAKNGDNKVKVSVIDTGIGIPREEQPRIFDQFYRVENFFNGGTVGSGLGLSIAKSIVERHGGTIGVKSEPGKGSIFTFSLRKGSD